MTTIIDDYHHRYDIDDYHHRYDIDDYHHRYDINHIYDGRHVCDSESMYGRGQRIGSW